jgi:hypothetical protein
MKRPVDTCRTGTARTAGAAVACEAAIAADA